MMNSKEIKKLSFEEALGKLEEIVKKIDTGQEDLANAVESFEYGVLLREHCASLLKEAKLKIEKIVKSSDGQVLKEQTEL
ncbi:MAG: hypothetical protein DGJ47_000624 [Rickettsiaceae bacterium]